MIAKSSEERGEFMLFVKKIQNISKDKVNKKYAKNCRGKYTRK